MTSSQVCPDCDGAGCPRCQSGNVPAFDPEDVSYELPDEGWCPQCGEPCELRLEDGARWCRHCDEGFGLKSKGSTATDD